MQEEASSHLQTSQGEIPTQPNQTSPQKSSNILKMILLVVVLFILIGILGIGAYLLTKDTKESEKPADNTAIKTDESNNAADSEAIAENMVFKKETASLPSWVTNDPGKKDQGPWFSALYMATSEEGLTFTDEKLFLEHAGVANVILTSDEKLIATYQYFSYVHEELFDKIAYSTSDDYGTTWSSIKRINITGLPQGPNAVDPTLVELEDETFRLYFTYHQQGDQYPQLFSAKADSIDGDFVNEGQQLFTDEIILDPAVVYFNEKWHHYTVKHGDSFETEPSENPVSVHSVSDNGLAFKLAGEIQLTMQFLGDVIEDDGGLRFYGGQKSAFSTDGYEWTLEEGDRLEGADPGVVKLPDGTYITIYTKVNSK